MRHVISALVMNEPGVLAGVANMFSARGFNIDSLVVGRTENPGLSRMTIVVTGDDNTVDQVRKQLGKLVPVVNVHDFGGTAYVERDLALVTVGIGPGQRGEILDIAQIFRGEIVDVSPDAIMVELTGSEEVIDRFVELVRPYGIQALARTGVIAMPRGVQPASAIAVAAAPSPGGKRKRSLDAPAAAALPPS